MHPQYKPNHTEALTELRVGEDVQPHHPHPKVLLIGINLVKLLLGDGAPPPVLVLVRHLGQHEDAAVVALLSRRVELRERDAALRNLDGLVRDSVRIEAEGRHLGVGGGPAEHEDGAVDGPGAGGDGDRLKQGESAEGAACETHIESSQKTKSEKRVWLNERRGRDGVQD